jgi:hypothetical protein
MLTRRSLLLLAALLSVPAVPAQDNERLLDYRIVGSSSCKTAPCWGRTIERIEVQRLLLQLAGSPQTADAVDASLTGSGVTRDDLEKLRLVRREGNRCVLNFSLFTADDTRRIREVGDRYAQSLAGEIVARRQEIEAALAPYGAAGVDPRAVAFILLGCVSLDWDGLDLTARDGYSKSTDRRPDGRYVPWAEQRSGSDALRGVYWGSHNVSNAGLQMTSFGDHFSVPRRTFPDLFDRPGELRSVGRVPASLAATGSLGKAGFELGRIMVALRDRERTLDELAAAARVTPAEAESWMALLSGLDWVAARGGTYATKIPVFTKRDVPTIRRVRQIGREVMDRWLARNYPQMKADLGETTPVRWGVPYAEGFTLIWHWVFGLTNQRLVKSGLFADPYDPGRREKGFIPCVFDAGTL